VSDGGEFKLSDEQRTDLCHFISVVDAVVGDGTFDPEADFSDAELMAFAIRGATLLGFEGPALQELFLREFEIAGVTEGDLDTMLSIVMLPMSKIGFAPRPAVRTN
jgi:hypothetical protein